MSYVLRDKNDGEFTSLSVLEQTLLESEFQIISQKSEQEVMVT